MAFWVFQTFLFSTGQLWGLAGTLLQRKQERIGCCNMIVLVNLTSADD